MGENRLLVLSGPTASGKTAIAIALAKRFPLEIVNADSMQVYRGMDIGTAKPSPEERAGTPHHLIDVADPGENYTAGRFVEDAGRAMEGIRGRGRFPLLAGGTGMYLRALLRGLDPLPSDPRVRQVLARRFDEEGGAALHRELGRLDPAAVASSAPRDKRRVVRALEIVRITGEAPSARRVSWERTGGRYRVLFLALAVPRDELLRRIDERVEAMFSAGFLDEVERLLAMGYAPELKSMSSLGYRHAVAHLRGGLPLEAAKKEMKRDTRRYAKRQMTWLSREPGVVWLERDSAVSRGAELAKNFLL
ncbi:MAG: tRNA (adenosine(37)-N6)-dimethylallyltransferase MiaA [Deltaproteobacteria bacterium]|nr:tRNA (adenosine(37)-N6)-dimethylallyltransferase MiaA [Deltaproteobacteria bacterium]